MKNSVTMNIVTAISMAASLYTVNATTANAGSHFTPPGMELCLVPGGCPIPPAGGGGIIMPPPPPAPPGPAAPSGGGGGFGSGIGAGIGLGIGLGIVNSLNRPRTVIVQQPTYVQPVQSGLHPHDQYCLGKYKSYNIRTKQYLSYGGQFKFCRSPYM
ncbi:MAG: BA14K family protein [Salaquimonas sp.]